MSFNNTQKRFGCPVWSAPPLFLLLKCALGNTQKFGEPGLRQPQGIASSDNGRDIHILIRAALPDFICWTDASKFVFNGAQKKQWEGVPHTFAEWVEKGHGRIETRRCWVVGNLGCLGKDHKWPQAKTLAKVEAIRETNGVASTECRYYISSLLADAERMGTVVRGHWGVENGLHWSLDVAYGEDRSRLREGQLGGELLDPAAHHAKPSETGQDRQGWHQEQAADGGMG